MDLEATIIVLALILVALALSFFVSLWFLWLLLFAAFVVILEVGENRP